MGKAVIGSGDVTLWGSFPQLQYGQGNFKVIRHNDNQALVALHVDTINWLISVPELPLCLGVLKHRASLARGGGGGVGGHLPANFYFTMDFYLWGTILDLKAFCFGAIPYIMIQLIVWECVTKSYLVYPLQDPSKGPHNLPSTWSHLS